MTAGNDEIASNTPATPEYLAAFENDIVGYNYPDRWRTRREVNYALDKAEFPNRRVVATESSGLGGARRQYVLPDAQPVMPTGAGQNGFSPQQVNNAQMQQMMRNMRRASRGIVNSGLIDVEQRWRFAMSYDYEIRDFMWTCID